MTRLGASLVLERDGVRWAARWALGFACGTRYGRTAREAMAGALEALQAVQEGR